MTVRPPTAALLAAVALLCTAGHAAGVATAARRNSADDGGVLSAADGPLLSPLGTLAEERTEHLLRPVLHIGVNTTAGPPLPDAVMDGSERAEAVIRRIEKERAERKHLRGKPAPPPPPPPDLAAEARRKVEEEAAAARSALRAEVMDVVWQAQTQADTAKLRREAEAKRQEQLAREKARSEIDFAIDLEKDKLAAMRRAEADKLAAPLAHLDADCLKHKPAWMCRQEAHHRARRRHVKKKPVPRRPSPLAKPGTVAEPDEEELPGYCSVLSSSPIVRLTKDVRPILKTGEQIKIQGQKFRVLEPRDQFTLTLGRRYVGKTLDHVRCYRVPGSLVSPSGPGELVPLPGFIGVTHDSPIATSTQDLRALAGIGDIVVILGLEFSVVPPMDSGMITLNRAWPQATKANVRIYKKNPPPAWAGGGLPVPGTLIVTHNSPDALTSEDLTDSVLPNDMVQIGGLRFGVKAVYPPYPSPSAATDGALPLSGSLTVQPGSPRVISTSNLQTELAAGDTVRIGEREFTAVSPIDEGAITLDAPWPGEPAPAAHAYKLPRRGVALQGRFSLTQGSKLLRATDSQTGAVSAGDVLRIGDRYVTIAEVKRGGRKLRMGRTFQAVSQTGLRGVKQYAGPLPLDGKLSVTRDGLTVATSVDLRHQLREGSVVRIGPVADDHSADAALGRVFTVKPPVTAASFTLDAAWPLDSRDGVAASMLPGTPLPGKVSVSPGRMVVSTDKDCSQAVVAGSVVQIGAQTRVVLPPISASSFHIDAAWLGGAVEAGEAWLVPPAGEQLPGTFAVAQGSASVRTTADIRSQMRPGDVLQLGIDKFILRAPLRADGVTLDHPYPRASGSGLRGYHDKLGSPLPGSGSVKSGEDTVLTSADVSSSLKPGDLLQLGKQRLAVVDVTPTTIKLEKPYAGTPLAAFPLLRLPSDGVLLPGSLALTPGQKAATPSQNWASLVRAGDTLRVGGQEYSVEAASAGRGQPLQLDRPFAGVSASMQGWRVLSAPEARKLGTPLTGRMQVRSGDVNVVTTADVRGEVGVGDMIKMKGEVYTIREPTAAHQLTLNKPYESVTEGVVVALKVESEGSALPGGLTVTHGSPNAVPAKDLTDVLYPGAMLRIKTGEYRCAGVTATQVTLGRPYEGASESGLTAWLLPATNALTAHYGRIKLDHPYAGASSDQQKLFKLAGMTLLSGTVSTSSGTNVLTPSVDMRGELAVGDQIKVGEQLFTVLAPFDQNTITVDHEFEGPNLRNVKVRKVHAVRDKGTLLSGRISVTTSSTVAKTSIDLRGELGLGDTVELAGQQYTVTPPMDATEFNLDRPWPAASAPNLEGFRLPMSQKQRTLRELANAKLKCDTIYCLAKIEAQERDISTPFPRVLDAADTALATAKEAAHPAVPPQPRTGGGLRDALPEQAGKRERPGVVSKEFQQFEKRVIDREGGPDEVVDPSESVYKVREELLL